MHCVIAIGLLLATATGEAHGNFFQRWLTQSQLPSWQTIAGNREDTLPAFAVDPNCSKTTTIQRAVYIVETKQMMVVPGARWDLIILDVPSDERNTDMIEKRLGTEPMVYHALQEPVTTTTTPAPGESTDVLPPQPFVRPAPGYTYVPETGSMYKFHENGAPWDDAEATCEREGGHLVVLNGAVEADAIVNILNKAGYNYTWVGLRDRRPEGKIDWRTVSGEPVSMVYNRWDNGRPYKNGDWTCGFLFDDKLLYDSPCYVPNFFTCEISQL